MRILVIGSGGREHALAWAIAKSPRCEKLYVMPGNGGTGAIAENVAIDITDHAAVVGFALANAVDFVVIGPDAPAVAGLGDDVRAAGILCFGPSKAAAQLEGSKAFTKELCDEAGVPTAAYGRFDNEAGALAYVRERGAPIVIKADGLAAGKGVTVAMSIEEAEDSVRDCFSGAFGDSGSTVVIEDYLEGEEASLFALCDGESVVMLPSAQDHKRVWDGDRGPNTGGMGAYSPAPVMTPEMTARVENEIILPSIRRMAERGTPFTGVLFAGIMVTAGGPKLIEYNVRFGDPECQVLMLRLQSDALDLLEATARGTLSAVKPVFSDDAALTVVLAAKGYPVSFEKGSEIRGVDGLDGENLVVFHAGTFRPDGKLLANGGRVLDVTALGRTVAEARDRAYAAVDKIDWPEGFCRRDIGWRAVARELKPV
ncbi:MAG: Phosphoribosylamine--glycine ligase [Devosia sp.]|uniref:phosphoribosylamine--glycine ligase n=1 Tax=Devosia sp. TaxID=1871048 RepID=UPI002635E743|nr:phosphoribosylamine--glycine ligase [Devosia sp.]MDB5541140.1 Phosphoribosylamine--glycine ligase [Devosia sp.]